MKIVKFEVLLEIGTPFKYVVFNVLQENGISMMPIYTITDQLNYHRAASGMLRMDILSREFRNLLHKDHSEGGMYYCPHLTLGNC